MGVPNINWIEIHKYLDFPLQTTSGLELETSDLVKSHSLSSYMLSQGRIFFFLIKVLISHPRT